MKRVKIDYDREIAQEMTLLQENWKYVNKVAIRNIPVDANVSGESDEIKEAIQKIKDKKEK